MNTNQITQIFRKMAKAVTQSLDSDSAARTPAGPIPTIRGGMKLPERAAESYIEALDEVTAIAGTDKTWSKSTIDDVIWEQVEKVLQVLPAQRADAIRFGGNEIGRRFGETPSLWTVDLLVYGIDSGCADLSFGELTFLSDEVVVDEADRPLLAELLNRKQMFARLKTVAIDEQSAIYRAEATLDEHLAALNSLCPLGRPSLVRASRVNNIDRTESVHRVGKSADSMGPMGFQAATTRVPLMRPELEHLSGNKLGEKISAMLTSLENEFHKRLVSGYALAGSACVDIHPERSFLMFAIALESVVLGRETKSELTHQLATRVAHLIGNGPAGRKHVARWVNNLYERRSRIVHRGEYGVSRTELALIQYYCMSALANLTLSPAFEGFNANSQLEAWFRDRMLEGPYQVGPDS